MSPRRPVAIAAFIASLMTSLAAAGADPTFRIVPVLDGGPLERLVGNTPLPGLLDPFWVVPNPATGKAYAGSRVESEVEVVDTGINAGLQTIQLAARSFAAAVNPVTDKVYVIQDDGDVVRIDGGAAAVERTFDVAANPVDIAVDSTTNRVYVAHASAAGLTILDEALDEVRAIPAGGLGRLAVDEQRGLVYAIQPDSGILVVDAALEQVALTLPAPAGGFFVSDIAVDEGRNKVYLTNEAPGVEALTIFDRTSGTSKTLPLAPSPLTVSLDPAAARVYVLAHEEPVLTVLDGDTDDVVARVGFFALGLREASCQIKEDSSADASTHRLYVPCRTGNMSLLTVYDCGRPQSLGPLDPCALPLGRM